MDYYDKQDSLIALMRGLQYRGWLIYGYNPDQSDSMTDYFHPASWDGIAVKNGYILVIDCYRGGSIGGSYIHRSYDAKIQQKLQKLYALRDNHAASEGEKANAQAIIDSLSKKVVTEIMEESGQPEVTYQKNPGNAKWHIEKDGKIIDKGAGVFIFGNVDKYDRGESTYDYKRRDDNFHSYRTMEYYSTDEIWDKHYANDIMPDRNEAKKLLDKYVALLNKWDSHVVIKLGDGDTDGLVQKTVEKKTVYHVAEISDTPTEYVQVGKGWTRYHGLEKGYIYKVKDEGYFKLTPKWITLKDGKGIKAYKPEPNKSTKRTFVHINENDFSEKNAVYINLVQKEEITEELVWVRESKAKPKPTKQQTKKCDAPKKEIIVQDSTEDKFSKLIENGHVKDFEHTRTGEMLKVLVVTEDLGKEGFIEFNKHMIKSGKGYYSRPAQGWILKDKSVA